MADQDLEVDQSAEDEPTGAGSGAPGPGGGAPGPGGGTPRDGKDVAPSDGPGDGESADGDQPPSSGTDVDPLGDPKDGPPTFEDDGGGEGLVGAGGGGSSSGGGLFGDIGDAVSDAYDDVEDSVNDASDDARDAAATGYGKVEDGVASLADDVETEVAEEWRDLQHNEGGFDEHQGGFLWDPEGTVAAPFQAVDRAYDAVEDDVADAVEDSGLKDPLGDAAGDAYDAWKTLDDAPGDAISDGVWHTNHALWGNQNAEDIYENVEASVAKAYDDTEGAVDDTFGQGAKVVGDAVDGDFGSGAGGGTAPDIDEFGRDGENESAAPLASDETWDASQQVAEQAGEEDAQEATSQLGGLLDELPPIDTPEPEVLELD